MAELAMEYRIEKSSTEYYLGQKFFSPRVKKEYISPACEFDSFGTHFQNSVLHEKDMWLGDNGTKNEGPILTMEYRI